MILEMFDLNKSFFKENQELLLLEDPIHWVSPQ